MKKILPILPLLALLAACGTGHNAPVNAGAGTPSTAADSIASAEAQAEACTSAGDVWDGTNCDPASPTPSPSPTVVPPTKVEFVVSGYAPGDPECGGGCDPDITYGSDSDTHDVQRAIDGTVTYSVPYDPNAEFYSIDVTTDTSSSHVKCKIVVVGPSPDVPLTASKGSETGENICSAQAAPEDSSGLTWDDGQ